jgi:hypothetical protein
MIMEIDLNNYDEIKKTEYERQKKINYHNTLRIGFKYFVKKVEVDIRTARRCLNHLRFHCENEYCQNRSCPLNKQWQ